MMENLNPSETVILNPILQSRPVMIALDLPKPVYAVTQNGIYKIKKAQHMRKEGYKVFLVTFSAIFSLLFLIAGISGLTVPGDETLGIIFIVMALGGFFFSWKKWREVKESQTKNTIPAEPVVPWSQVKSIIITNVRQINTGTILNPVIREVGEWHVLTVDGKDIVIPEVDDPYDKLDYVKNRFGLKI